MGEIWSLQCAINFNKQLKKQPEKKIQAWTGFGTDHYWGLIWKQNMI